MNNTTRALKFIEHWNNRDIDGIMNAMTDDCFYHNIPMEPQRGKEEIRPSLEAFIQMASNIEWIVHNIAENPDGIVLTERTDRFEINGQWMEETNNISLWLSQGCYISGKCLVEGKTLI